MRDEVNEKGERDEGEGMRDEMQGTGTRDEGRGTRGLRGSRAVALIPSIGFLDWGSWA
jgi:hypothetical protein